MKAITLWQPWASLLACGAKIYETRSWDTKYRGPIAIHAAMKDVCAIMRSLPHDVQKAMFDCLYATFGIQSGAHKKLPIACIIAVADLVGCWRIKDICGSTRIDKDGKMIVISGNELLFGDYTPGRYAWEFANMRLLSVPIQVKGKQGLWNWEGLE